MSYIARKEFESGTRLDYELFAEAANRKIANLAALLNAASALAKQEIHRHLSVVTMHPVGDGRKWHYEAEGS